MKDYHKIQTFWLRDPETGHKRVIEGRWVSPEFEYLQNCEWIFTEKIDGTNVRVTWDGTKIIFDGRTKDAQMSMTLLRKLQEMFVPERFQTIFGNDAATVYGEGYGVKLGKGGGNYIPDDVSFVGFDVFCGGYWLRRPDIEDVCNKLDVDVIPVIGRGTLHDAVKLVKEGFPSQFRSTPPEGIVIKPALELFARNGDRIISKLKRSDFGL